MADDRLQQPAPPEGNDWTGWTDEDQRRRQTRRGLELTPAERLRWLEETMTELREVQGRARRAGRPRRH